MYSSGVQLSGHIWGMANLPAMMAMGDAASGDNAAGGVAPPASSGGGQGDAGDLYYEIPPDAKLIEMVGRANPFLYSDMVEHCGGDREPALILLRLMASVRSLEESEALIRAWDEEEEGTSLWEAEVRSFVASEPQGLLDRIPVNPYLSPLLRNIFSAEIASVALYNLALASYLPWLDDPLWGPHLVPLHGFLGLAAIPYDGNEWGRADLKPWTHFFTDEYGLDDPVSASHIVEVVWRFKWLDGCRVASSRLKDEAIARHYNRFRNAVDDLEDHMRRTLQARGSSPFTKAGGIREGMSQYGLFCSLAGIVRETDMVDRFEKMLFLYGAKEIFEIVPPGAKATIENIIDIFPILWRRFDAMMEGHGI